jgi:PRC-barrel domain
MPANSFRVGLLFGRPVVDADGRVIGRVHDVRLRRDGPFIRGFGPALRIEGLVVGRGSIAQRLGFDRADMKGPWPLDVWGKRAVQRARFVPWETLEIADKVITCNRRADELPSAQ